MADAQDREARLAGGHLRRAAVPLLLAAAAAPDRLIVLPGASSAEGIAAGRDATFYAGDLFRGDIFRGNVRRGTARLFIDAPTAAWPRA